MDPLKPFDAVLIVIAGIVAVVGGFVGVDRWQEYRVAAILRNRKLEAREEEEEKLRESISEIVSAAFTGRVEADSHFRAEALMNYKTVLREALDDHTKDERRYIDTLRDKITEYHATSLQAINDAKRVALHVSNEYNAIKARLTDIEAQLVLIKRELASHEHPSRGSE